MAQTGKFVLQKSGRHSVSACYHVVGRYSDVALAEEEGESAEVVIRDSGRK